MNTSRVASVVVAIAAVGVLSGCSMAGCSGEHAQPASITVHAAAWTASHPGRELEACLGKSCVALNGATNVAAENVESSNYRYTITLIDASSAEVVGKLETKLPTVSEKTGCGNAARQVASVMVSNTGELSLTS